MSAVIAINETLKEYSTSAAVDDWGSKRIVRLAHEWWIKMAVTFGIEAATPAIRIERLRSGAAGCYRFGRNSFGLLHQLSIDPRRLDESFALFLVGLLREALRDSQNLQGLVGSPRYYSSALRRKASGLGVRFGRCGQLLGISAGPFTEFLAREGVDTAGLTSWQPGQPVPPRPRETTWVCACGPLRARHTINGMCFDCGQRYVPQTPNNKDVAPQRDSGWRSDQDVAPERDGGCRATARQPEDGVALQRDNHRSPGEPGLLQT